MVNLNRPVSFFDILEFAAKSFQGSEWAIALKIGTIVVSYMLCNLMGAFWEKMFCLGVTAL